MIVAKELHLSLKNHIVIDYQNLTQIYTIGNFITVTGIRGGLGTTVPITDKHMISDVVAMTVWFNKKED